MIPVVSPADQHVPRWSFPRPPICAHPSMVRPLVVRPHVVWALWCGPKMAKPSGAARPPPQSEVVAERSGPHGDDTGVLAGDADAPGLARVTPSECSCLRSHPQFRPNCAAPQPPRGRHRWSRSTEVIKCATAKPRQLRAWICRSEPHLSPRSPSCLVQRRQGQSALRPMQTEVFGRGLRQRSSAEVIGR
jgi:hypothetical protein